MSRPAARSTPPTPAGSPPATDVVVPPAGDPALARSGGPADRTTAGTPRIAVALGAGGARGLAHVVLLEVLDELGLRPVALAGCSMGAVVGAAYAAGLTGREVRAHVLGALRSRGRVLGRLLEARVGRFADLLARRLANPVLVDAERLLPPFWAEGIPEQFEDLAIPLAVMVTDFNAREGLLIRSGSLRSAVAGSIAVPGLVQPVERDGRVLVDGGVVDPLPYGALFDVADLVLASDASQGPVDEAATAVPQPVQAMLGAAQIMQATITARTLRDRPPHLLLRTPTERFRLLDFFGAARILEAADARRDAVRAEVVALVERWRAAREAA